MILGLSRLLWSSNSFRFEFFFFVDHCFYSIIHVLDKLSLASAKSSFIGNIIDVVIGFSVLTMCASNLNVILVCNCLENVHLFSKVR